MKKLTALLLSLVFALSLAACAADTAETPNDTPQPDDWGITFTVKDVTSSGLTLVITQTGSITGGNLETGAEYHLEQTFDGVNWSLVTPMSEPVWDMMLRFIPADDTMEWELNWEWLYDVLSAGRYRICKTITLSGENAPAESRFYSAEFEIK